MCIPKWKWDTIYMDFITGFHKTSKGSDIIWVDFIPIKISYSLQKLGEAYIKKIVIMHGIPSSIISDRDLRFTSRF